jgi:competence protein ComEC
MKRACIAVLLLAAVLTGLSVGRPLSAAVSEAPSQPAVWLALVSNAPTPTGTPTPTATPSPTPTITPAPTPIPARVRVAAWCCQFDVPGNDGDRYNEEYVCLTNEGGQVAQMAGWKVRDEAGNTYTFPSFLLWPGAWVRLHTGSGSNTATDLYWGQRRFIWNNDSDTVFLYDERGALVETYTY